MPDILQRASQHIKFRAWTVPLALLLLCAISYGSMASQLGFYWDDWTNVHTTHMLGPSSFLEIAAQDRPASGWVFMLTASLLGESPLERQLFGVFARWLLCLALWWLLNTLWPKKTFETTAAALLFAVYPGFQQQYIATTWGTWFIVYGLFLVSLGAMNWSLRSPRLFWPLYLASIALGVYSMFAVEYFFGLEFLRPVFIWMILGETVREVPKRIRRTGLYWAPYAISIALFLVYRISTPTPRGRILMLDQIGANPFAAILGLGRTIIQDLIEASVLAWKQTFDLSTVLSAGPMAVLKYATICLGAAALAVFYLALLQARDEDASAGRRRWARQAILVGLFALLIAGVPIWMTNLRITLSFPFDRFTLAMMLGASLLLIGLIELLTRTRLQSAVIVGLAVGLAAGMHFQVALRYRQDWLMQREFFWQLTWRAPSIQPGSLLLTSDMPFPYNTDNSLTAPTNWTYNPESASRELSYLLLDIERLAPFFPDLNEESLENYRTIRIVSFNGSIKQTLFVFYQPPGCLKVIDPQFDQYLPYKLPYLPEALALSRPGLILADAGPPAQPPDMFFGPEPEHGWCYDFEKAELARQVGDWERVAELADRALANNPDLNRRSQVELVPFIQGYAHTGQWDRAVQLTLQAYSAWDKTRLVLCHTWQGIHRSTAQDERGQAAFDEIRGALQCIEP